MLDLLNTQKAAAIAQAAGGAAVSRETADGIVAVPLSQIFDNPYQPRGNHDPEHILKLATSIKRLKRELPTTLGLQQIPLARLVFKERSGDVRIGARSWYEGGKANRTIMVDPDAAVQLMFGHSRLRAFMLLSDGLRYALKHTHFGINFRSVAEVETLYADLLQPDTDYATMPMMLGFALDHAMWQHAITENSQRKNITAIEEAQSIKRAMDEFGLSTEDAGKPFGYERSTTANKIRLLNLPADVQKAIAAGDLSERHGRELLRVAADPARVQKLATLAVQKGQPVRQLAESVKWEEDSLKREQERDRQFAAARELLADGWRTPADQPMPADRLCLKTDWGVYRFDSKDPKDRMLIEQNGCGPHCACFVLTHYEGWGLDTRYRPNPTTMPNICLACSDRDAYNAQCKALGEVADDGPEARAKREEEAKRKQQAAALNNEAHTLWQRWVAEQDKHALWSNIVFWQLCMAHSHWSVASIIEKAPDTPTACAKLLKLLYQSTRKVDETLREMTHTVSAVKKLIKALEGRQNESQER